MITVKQLKEWMDELNCPTANVLVRPNDYKGDPFPVVAVSGGLAGGVILEAADAHMGKVSEMEAEVEELEETVSRLEDIETWAESAYEIMSEQEEGAAWIDKLLKTFPQ